MAITIRNRRTEQRIRHLCEIFGEGPSATISRLVDKEIRERDPETEDERIARRRATMRSWLASLPPISAEDSREMDRIMEEMYDEKGLPR